MEMIEGEVMKEKYVMELEEEKKRERERR